MSDLQPTRKRPGPRPSGNAKVRLTLRVDKEALAALRASGKGWQTRASQAVEGLATVGDKR